MLLSGFRKRRGYFVAVDSDGCVFDTMAVKQTLCFAPAIAEYFGFQSVPAAVLECTKFVNLFSTLRGVNRFTALRSTFDYLRVHPGVLASAVRVPDLFGFSRWLAENPNPNVERLAKAVDSTADSDLSLVKEWSDAVDVLVRSALTGLPPFGEVREALTALERHADMIVCSTSPEAELTRQWSEHDLLQMVQIVCGQEAGPKCDILSAAVSLGYSPANILMIGDSPVDFAAAQSVGACFFPVLAEQEGTCWKALKEEGVARFLSGSFSGDYQAALIGNFGKSLSDLPPWVR